MYTNSEHVLFAYRSGSADSDGTAESDSSKSSILTPKVARQNSGLRLRLPLPLVNNSDSGDNSEGSPTSVKEVKDKILASSKSILGKVLSPTKEKFARDKVSVLCYFFYTNYTNCEWRLNTYMNCSTAYHI